MEGQSPAVFSPTIESTENPFVYVEAAARKPGAATSGYEVCNENNVMTNSYKLRSSILMLWLTRFA